MNENLKIGLIGPRGKMGSVFLEEAQQYIATTCDKEDDFSKKVSVADVWIDFSVAEKAAEHSGICQDNNKPFVIGTTGNLNFEQIKQYSQIPIIHAPNASLSFLMLRNFMKNFSHWDVIITDTHHKSKKDKPSGASKTLVEIFTNNIEMNSFRNEINGTKINLQLSKDDEMLEVSYSTFGRKAFARGALKLCFWIYKQKPGFYELNDVDVAKMPNIT